MILPAVRYLTPRHCVSGGINPDQAVVSVERRNGETGSQIVGGGPCQRSLDREFPAGDGLFEVYAPRIHPIPDLTRVQRIIGVDVLRQTLIVSLSVCFSLRPIDGFSSR